MNSIGCLTEVTAGLRSCVTRPSAWPTTRRRDAPPRLQVLRSDAPEFIGLRRGLHRHPEHGLAEARTSRRIADRLQAWGYELHRGLATTGVVGTLRRGTGTRRLGLRAGMDALPVRETSDRDRASVHDGVMHACGHDGHSAMLRAAARRLAGDTSFSGTLHLIFPPAEEHPGGAKPMIEQGRFDRFPCEAVFAMHNMPGIAQGRLVFREGPTMASSDDVSISLNGIGGHGAMPHRAADPVVAAASIVVALQTVVSRNIDPQPTAIVTVGALHAGRANNATPQTATRDRGGRGLLGVAGATLSSALNPPGSTPGDQACIPTSSSAPARVVPCWRPARPVTLVVPWPAGGPSDFVARQIQNGVSKALGQTLIVGNVGGVGGALGVQKMLAGSDGCSLRLGSPQEPIIPPLTIASLKYQPNDLRLAAQLVKAPMVLLAGQDLPAGNLEELLALANTGPGSMFHLIGETFAQQTGLDLLHVPCKGSAPAPNDLFGGQVVLMFTVFAGPVPGMIADGKPKAIGLTTAQPLAKYPNLPALAAQPKLAGLEFDSWAGVQVPRSTPEDPVVRLNKALNDAMANPQTRQAFENAGNRVESPISPADLDRLDQAEIARYQAIARSINLQPQQ